MSKKEIKVEWCKNWIKKLFEKRLIPGGGIECDLFWNMAEKSGLWERGTYGSPMTQAVVKLTVVETVPYCYNFFMLK